MPGAACRGFPYRKFSDTPDFQLAGAPYIVTLDCQRSRHSWIVLLATRNVFQ